MEGLGFTLQMSPTAAASPGAQWFNRSWCCNEVCQGWRTVGQWELTRRWTMDTGSAGRACIPESCRRSSDAATQFFQKVMDFDQSLMP